MTPAARVQAAIDVVGEIEARRGPAAAALKEWGLAHRFAGSADRAAISGLVYDAMRRRASAAFVMGSETPRAILLGTLRLERGLDADGVAQLACGLRHGPPPLAADEIQALREQALDCAPTWVRGDYPEWLDLQFLSVFGDERAQEGAALAQRAPLDLRANVIKSDRATAAAALAHLNAVPTRWSANGLRIVSAAGAKSVAVQSEPAFLKGHVEVQDEGSQIAALLAGAQPGEQVVDLCAGAGGKTLALAVAMRNRGQIFATDTDKRRLARIHERIERAGVRNAQVRTPRGEADTLADIAGHADLVLVDAPCTGTGTWRRNADAKWRVRPGALEQRAREQAQVLDRAAGLVKSGGRIAYVTCSVLAPENDGQVGAFLNRHPRFTVVARDQLLAPFGDLATSFRDAVL
ncbi:MAG: RsmB/NOP family class I SAM-dependent RNA methyltransferase, partial [Proteobacteria bacterium]|nr:RsmB/NOP family class I SAM-dependent RNA methyltransferase [Pseudomonadota bacterium]